MSLAFCWRDRFKVQYLYDLQLCGGWWGGSRSLDTDRNQVGKTDSPQTVGSPRAMCHVSGDVSHSCEVSGVHWPRSWQSTDISACCRCSSDARHNTDLVLLPPPASTRALTGEMKPDAQFLEARGQRDIELWGLDWQKLAPIVAETIRRVVIKWGGSNQWGLTLVMAETIHRVVIKRQGWDRWGLTLIMAETICRVVIKRRGRDRWGLTLIMAEMIHRAVIKRRGWDRRGLTLIMAEMKRWVRELQSDFTERVSLPADQELTLSLPGGENNSRTCKAKHGSANELWHWASREKVQWKNKQTQINLDGGSRVAQRTHHQVVQSMKDTLVTVNNPKQWESKEKTLTTGEQNTHGLLGVWSLSLKVASIFRNWFHCLSYRLWFTSCASKSSVKIFCYVSYFWYWTLGPGVNCKDHISLVRLKQVLSQVKVWLAAHDTHHFLLGRIGKGKVEWSMETKIRKMEFLAVGEACKTIFWAIWGLFEGNHF